MVLATEVGGRWSKEAWSFLRMLAKSRAREQPRIMQASVQAAFQNRWSALLSVAAQRAFAATLLDLSVEEAAAVDGEQPVLEEVLMEGRATDAPVPSRLPGR